jgi:hypothetical protein
VLTHLPFTHTPLAIRSPTPTVISFTSIIVAPASAPGVLGVVPSNCPPGNPIHTFSPSYAPGVSVDTLGIWVVGFSDINATLHLERSPKTPLGWEKKLVIVAASTLTADITLWIESIASLPGADTTTPHLSRGGAGLATTALTLNLKTAPVSFEGEWTSWPLNVFIPSSGCYSLDFRYGGAEISGTYFAAGQ